jgi:sugar O-acyltransferase (sialic acid O-acetyltransferase NeuD family)
MDRRWTLYACRTPYAAEVAEIIWRCGDRIAALVDNIPSGGLLASSLGTVITPDQVNDEVRATAVVIPLLTPGHRHALHGEALGLGLRDFPALVDPTAVVARTARIAEGSVVNAGAVVGAGASLGRFVHCNRSASLGHDVVIDDFATLGPGAVLAGHVVVGRGAFIGAGVTCAPKVTIGANSVIGVGAVVARDVPAGGVVSGNPGKLIRQGPTGYAGVAVPLQ